MFQPPAILLSRLTFFCWVGFSAKTMGRSFLHSNVGSHGAARHRPSYYLLKTMCSYQSSVSGRSAMVSTSTPTSTEYWPRKQTKLWWIFHSRGGSIRALMNEIMDPKKGKSSETFLSISRRKLGNSIFNSARILTFPYSARLSEKAIEERRKKNWKWNCNK